MRLQARGGEVFAFSYCMNVHPGESLQALHHALETHVPPIRNALCAGRPFGLGLRIADAASRELLAEEAIDRLRETLEAQNAYAFTINGFPFGEFHRGRVKEQVYAPDWRRPERLDYSLRLLDLLAALLPESCEGSISTVPLSFKPWGMTEGDLETILQHLVQVTVHAARLEEETGRCLHLGLEPEPSCYLETTGETIGFFEEALFRSGVAMLRKREGISASTAESWLRRHVGACLDTCHSALQFENPEENLRAYSRAGIRVSKVQISAALELDGKDWDPAVLEPFLDEVYLHQVIARRPDGSLARWVDLPEFLAGPGDDLESFRVHFHVPLHWNGQGPLQSTASTMTPAFWKALVDSDCRHLEVETYTFDVLPEDLGRGSVEDDMIEECRWALQHLHTAGIEGLV